MVEKKPRKQKMAITTIRMPAHVLDYFRINYPNGSKQIRKVLEQFIEAQGAKHEDQQPMR
jgi:hypothetical protein